MLSDRKAISRLIILLLLVSAAGLFLLYRYLPELIENKTRQIVLQKTPFSHFNAEVLHAGLNGIEIDHITAGDAQNSVLSIGSVNIRYSPAGLFQRRINAIFINDMALFLDLHSEGLSMLGYEINTLKKKATPAPTKISMPMDLEELQVKNGNLHLTVDGKQLVVPFNLVLKQETSGQQSYYKAILQISPYSEKVTITADIDLAGNTGLVKLRAESFKLEKFADLINAKPDMSVNGLATADAATEIKLQPLEVISAELYIGLQPLNLKFNDVQIEAQKNDSPGKQLQVSIEYKEKNLQYRIDNILLTEPFKGTLYTAGAMDFTDEKMSGTGDFSIAVLNIPALNIIDPIKVSGAAAYGYDRLSQNWHFDIKQSSAAPQQNIKMQYKDALIETGKLDFSVSGKGEGSTGEIAYIAAYPKITALQNDMKGSAGLSLTGDASISNNNENNDKKLQAAGFIHIAKGEIQLSNSALAVQDIKGAIPWQWPAGKEEKKGSISASEIKWQGNTLGSFGSDIILQDTTYNMNGYYTSSLLEGLILDISGQAGLTDGGLAAKLKMHTDAASFSTGKLGGINPSLAKTFMKGKLALDGSLQYDGNYLQGEMQADLQDGRLEFTEKKYVIDGIALSVQFPSLPQIRTSPAQNLDFSLASLGNISITDGRIAWQLESTDSLLIESSVFQWARGNLQINDARLAPDKDQQFITILCERLNLIEVLQQFGVKNAEGEGTVSGEIPLLLGKKTIDFKDGFLSSSPGEGGRIRVVALDILSAGIPKNSPQFAQVDFAAAALKNFRYDRVKLVLNSEGEDLVMQMQMEGKPLQALPFTYDSRTGLMTRIEDTKQGINQPIRLDVNFRLPLNRFLGYSGKIQDIMKTIT
jgi:hypothetical protein